MTTLRLVCWNARVGRDPLQVVAAVRALTDRAPDVIALLESTRYVLELRREFGTDWRVIRRGTDVVVLVRRDLGRIHARPVRHFADWFGPKAMLGHRGRAHLLLRVAGHRLLFLHRVPGGPSGGIVTRGRNRPAWLRESSRIIVVARRWLSAFVAGDQNCEVGEFEWPDEFDVYPTGAKVDWAWGRGYHVETRRLRRLGSDHPAVLYAITHKEPP